MISEDRIEMPDIWVLQDGKMRPETVSIFLITDEIEPSSGYEEQP